MTAAEAMGSVAYCGRSLPAMPARMPERNRERKDNTVSVIDTASDVVIAIIKVGKGPQGIAAGLLPTGP